MAEKIGANAAETASPYTRYLDAREARLEQGRDSPEILQSMQQALHDALAEAAKGEPLPPEMAAELMFGLREVISGQHAPLLEPAGRGHKNKRGATEQDCVVDAARYYAAVKTGRIRDRSPVKTIVEAFGGTYERCDGESLGRAPSRQQVQEWVKLPLPAHVRPDLTPRQIEICMRESGKYWARWFYRQCKQK